MQVRPIENTEFMDLCDLVVQMYSAIDKNINSFQAVNTLMHFINSTSDFIALGLYSEDVLVGFVMGNAINDTTFNYTGIFTLGRNNKDLKLLIEESFKFVEDKGYKAWEVDATNENISSIMEKYGAKVKYTRYYKEFDNG